MSDNLADLIIMFAVFGFILSPFLLLGWIVETIMEKREKCQNHPMATFIEDNED